MVFVVNDFFQIPSSSLREKRKKVENQEKDVDGLQKKTKANVNIDCLSLIKGQWKNCLKFSEKSSPTNTDTFHFVK